MARDIKLMIGGNAEKAKAEFRELKRAGRETTGALERDFAMLGAKSSLTFDNKRKAAQSAYDRIKASGNATSKELIRAEKALGKRLVAIDNDQFGKRLGLAEKFKANRIKIAAALGAAVAVAMAGITVGKKAIDEFEGFETALTDLKKVGVENIGAIREQIMALPPELGSATELVGGYYQAISAGVTDPKRAMELLVTASKSAKAAHLDQGEVIKALTKLMAGYGDKMKSATDASDLLFNMERFGQTTVAELVPVIGGLSSLSSQLDVLPNEMAAVVSSITQTAGTTAQAATQYEGILTGFIKPTKSMTEVLKTLGYESGKQLIGEKGLAGALMAVKKAAGESFGAQGMGKIFESKEAIIALGPLFADSFGKVKEVTEEMGKSAGATEDAFGAWRETFGAVKDAFNNTLKKVLLEIGKELVPSMITAMKGITTWISENKQAVVAFAKSFGDALAWAVKQAGELMVYLNKLASAPVTTILKTALAGSPVGYLAVQAAASNLPDTSGPTREQLMQAWNANAPSSTSGITDRTDGALFPSSYASGTSYVPRTGLYQLHRGEEVRTRGEASNAGQSAAPSISFGDLNLSLPNVTNQTSARQLAKELLPELSNLMRTRYRGAAQGA